MSEKSHTVAIGAFVIGACLIALATVLFLLGSGFGKGETVVMVFDGSVKGLNVGAPMTLRGVQVGQVTGIELILRSDKAGVIMMVEADLNAKNIRREGPVHSNLTEELITRGLRAQLNTQSLLTGLLYIELDFHPATPLNLADIDSPYIQLPTIPTNLQRIAQKLEDIDVSKLTNDLESISNGINSLVSSDEFQSLPANITSTMEYRTQAGQHAGRDHRHRGECECRAAQIRDADRGQPESTERSNYRVRTGHEGGGRTGICGLTHAVPVKYDLARSKPRGQVIAIPG
jgi:paraquat-inducible protein B